MAITKKRLISGAIFSPLAVPILDFLGVYFLSGYTDQGPGHIQKLFQLELGFAAYSYILSIGLGGALTTLLHKTNKLNVFNCIASSFCLGVISGVIFATFYYWPSASVLLILFGLAAGIAGLAVSVTFCLIAGVPRSIQTI
ncbi:MAG: hypothetical protein PHF31_05285 [Methylobacter sp.]|nr:hypothetical protein [Methylobacter sp.]